MATATHQLTEKEATAHPPSEAVVVRFAGDSGDGMQLTGGQFTLSTALAGNDLATFPDFPAEIRAPQGTTFGVSAFQINFGSAAIETAGDQPDVLIAMNPAALKVNADQLREGGLIIADEGEFTARNLAKAGYEQNPLEDGSLAKWQVVHFNISQLTLDAVKPFGLGNKEALRCKNMWTLGLALWMFDRDRQPIVDWLKAKFAKAPELAEANIAALNAGHAYGETAEMGAPFKQHHIAPAPAEPGLYRTVTGAEALALGLVAGCQLAGLKMFFGSYPITPASPLLHHLARLKEFGITTFQAEDEIAAICAAIGASYAGHLGITSSSGPGIALKTEGVGLAVMTELPLIVVNSQRGGPSTGLPTKTEQSDLYQAVYGRNADSPVPVIAARSPADAFECAIEACRIATHYMTPVMLLTDGYIANAAEPWRVPDMSGYAPFPVKFFDAAPEEGQGVMPYSRGDGLARPWIKPGTPGPRAPYRRDREAARHGQHRLLARRPPGDDRDARGQGARRRQFNSRSGDMPRPRRRRAGGGRLGLDLRSDPPGGAPRDRERAGRRARPCTPHLADAQKYVCPIEGLRAYPRARNEHGPVQDSASRPVSG